jgi:hypothetical protein
MAVRLVDGTYYVPGSEEDDGDPIPFVDAEDIPVAYRSFP